MKVGEEWLAMGTGNARKRAEVSADLAGIWDGMAKMRTVVLRSVCRGVGGIVLVSNYR